MSIPAVASLIISIAALVGTAIGVWVNAQKKQALAEQAIRFFESTQKEQNHRISQLEKKVADNEEKILEKFDEMQRSIHNIEILIAKMANK